MREYEKERESERVREREIESGRERDRERKLVLVAREGFPYSVDDQLFPNNSVHILFLFQSQKF